MHGGSAILRALGRFVGRYAWWIIAFWIAVAGILNVAIPQLEQTVAKHSAPFLPADLPGNETLRQMSKDFGAAPSSAVGSIVLSADRTISVQDDAYYQRLVASLVADHDAVAYVLDMYGRPATKDVALSPDKEAINLVVAAQGDVGSTRAHQSTNEIRGLIRRADPPPGLTVNFTGAAPTLADVFHSIDVSLLVITAVSVVLITMLLLAVYRSIAAAGVALATVGVSLAIARAVLSALGAGNMLTVSNFTIALATAMVLGATTDYAIFLIAGFHESRRRGRSVDGSVTAAIDSVGGIVVASALTIGAAGVSMAFTKIGMFKTAGPPIAIAIALSLLVSLTLPPALITVLGRRGLLEPRRSNEQRWRHTGVRIVRRAVPLAIASLVVLIALAAVLFTFRMNFDENRAQVHDTDSKRGYVNTERHWHANEAAPEYLLVRSDHDMRNTGDLAALELMANAVAQVPGVAYVRSITRPDGNPIAQSATGYQTNIIGGQLGSAHDQLSAAMPQLQQLASGTRQLDDGAAAAAAQLPALTAGTDQVVSMADGVLDAYTTAERVVGTLTDGSTTVPQAIADLRTGARGLSQVLNQFRASTDRMSGVLGTVSSVFAPIISAQPAPACLIDPQCMRARAAYVELNSATGGRAGQALAGAVAAAAVPAGVDRAAAVLPDVKQGLADMQRLIDLLGGQSPDQVRAQLNQLTNGMNQLTDGMRQLSAGLSQVRAGTDQMAAMTAKLNDGLKLSSDYLTTMSQHTSTGPGRGFYLPPQALSDPRFVDGAKLLMSPDGRSARMLVVWKINPYSSEALDRVGSLAAAAHRSAAGTVLSDAEVSSTGLSTLSAQMRDQVVRDFAVFAAVAIAMVLLILIVLLRSLVAPLILVGTVVLSFAAAAGLSTLLWQHIIGIDLDWSVLPVAFMALVAVGADYSMLFAARIRAESADGMVRGIIRGFGSTGSVITTAGLVFAVTMFALTTGSTFNLIQIGSTVGIGLLLDITVVRTILVPAAVTVLGDRIWWPAGRRSLSPGEPPAPQ